MKPGERRGQSLAGRAVRQSNEKGIDAYSKENHLEAAKNEHRAVLEEQKKMKKPNLYAEGGMACRNCGYAEGGFVDEENASGYMPNPMEHPDHMDEHMIPNQDEDDMLFENAMNPHSFKKYSEGGQVANDTGEGEEADKEPNQFDDLVKDDDLEFSYNAKNSGDEIGNAKHDEEEDEDMEEFMKSKKKKA